MKLTILGSSAAAPGKGRACSGYLVEEGEVRLLLDCGTGVLSNLQKRLPLQKITDIVVSHMHFDHFVDLIPFGYWRIYGDQGSVEEAPRLHLPPGGKKVAAGVISQVGAGPDFFERAYRVDEYSPKKALSLGTLRVAFSPVPHYVPSFAIAVSGGREAKLVFSADCAPSKALERLAKNATLLLCEATLESPEASENRGHMTAGEAAEIARAASVQRLVLTHFWPWTNRARALADAAKVFGEGVAIAEEDASYDL